MSKLLGVAALVVAFSCSKQRSMPDVIDDGGGTTGTVDAGDNMQGGTGGNTTTCSDLNSIENCGKCGNDCTKLPNVVGPAGISCEGGVCVIAPAACKAGWGHCSSDPDDGCETDIRTAMNCGACGASCGAGQPLCLTAGATTQCASTCSNAAPDACGTSCVDVSSDPRHCGKCGEECQTPNGAASCSQGACKVASCTTGYGDCTDAPGCETNIGGNDEANCGACGKTCEAWQTCSSGACSPRYVSSLVWTGQGVGLPGRAHVLNDGSFAIPVYGIDAATDVDPGSGRRTLSGGGLALVKFNPQNEYEWQVNIRKMGVGVEVNAVKQSGDRIVAVGHIYQATAIFEGTAGSVTKTSPGQSCFVLIIDPARRVQVATMDATSAADECVAADLLIDSSGFYFGGSVRGNITDGSGAILRGGPESDAYLARYAPDGSHLWTRLFNSDGTGLISSGASARSLLMRPNGGALVIGEHLSRVDLDPGSSTFVREPAAVSNVFGVSLTQDGTFVEAWSLEGNWLRVNGAAVVSGGDIVISGTSNDNEEHPTRWIDLDPGPGQMRVADARAFLLRLSGTKYKAGRTWPSLMQMWPVELPGGALAATGYFTGVASFGEPGNMPRLESDGRLFILHFAADLAVRKLGLFGGAKSEGNSSSVGGGAMVTTGALYNDAPADLNPGPGVESYTTPYGIFISRFRL